MKIYTGINKEIDSIEMLLNQEELRKMVNSLAKFEDEVNQFKTKNKDENSLGVTHLHFKDCGLIGKNDNPDVVIYLDLDE